VKDQKSNTTPFDALVVRCAQLEQELEAQTAQIAGLNAELAETNKGVVVLYSELDQQATMLRETTELKSRFLSYMSHEFRTPLGAMISIARLMLDRLDGPLTPEQEKQIRLILDASSELLQMVNDLLDLAKVEAGKISISPAWFEMVNLFAALRGMFKPILTTDSISLIFEEPAGIPRIYSDDRKVAQILRNFISNSLKFTVKGEVHVTATLGSDGQSVIFAVRDTGIGIAPEHQKRLFQDYAQVDSPLQKQLRGVGLGLSLSRQLAELLGGRIALESELGKGSTFSLHLPIQLPNSQSNEGGRPVNV